MISSVAPPASPLPDLFLLFCVVTFSLSGSLSAPAPSSPETAAASARLRWRSSRSFRSSSCRRSSISRSLAAVSTGFAAPNTFAAGTGVGLGRGADNNSDSSPLRLLVSTSPSFSSASPSMEFGFGRSGIGNVRGCSTSFGRSIGTSGSRRGARSTLRRMNPPSRSRSPPAPPPPPPKRLYAFGETGAAATAGRSPDLQLPPESGRSRCSSRSRL
uniref:Putative secreted peptide n=1 Tax=Anopheles braziliensis TaxID=58242 RepID=A0A2M3ZXT4_9DIPT